MLTNAIIPDHPELERLSRVTLARSQLHEWAPSQRTTGMRCQAHHVYGHIARTDLSSKGGEVLLFPMGMCVSLPLTPVTVRVHD